MLRRKKAVVTKVLFDRSHIATKSKATNRKKASVVIEVYYDTKRIYVNTGVKVYADQFKDGKVYNVGSQGQYNERIRITLDMVEEYINNTIKNGKKIVLSELKEYINNISIGNTYSFLGYMKKKIYERDIAESTRNKHLQIYRRLEEWGLIKTFSDISVANVERWHEQAKKVAISGSFTINYERVLRIYIREAFKDGLIKENPYIAYRVPKYTPTATHRYLTEEELAKIRNVTLTGKYLNIARDLFVFQCYTALAYVDMCDFKYDDLQEEDGKLKLRNKRIKTGEKYYITLLQPAVSILDKYKHVLPLMGLEAYNVNLKIVAKEAGVNKPISTHWGRHTAAVMMLNNGVPIEVLSKIMGHSNIETTQIYAKILQKSVDSAFDMLEEKLKAKGGL